MAKMRDHFPIKYHGEKLVWDALEKYLPDDVNVYYNHEVNNKEYDYCILLPHKGILLLEVKGWIPQTVKVKKDNNHYILTVGNDEQGNPQQQVRSYCFELKKKIKQNPKINKIPRIFSMICFPAISKKQFHELGLPFFIGEDHNILFQEDLENSTTLLEKIDISYRKSIKGVYDDFDEELILNIRKEIIKEPIDLTREKNIYLPYSQLHMIKNANYDETERKKELSKIIVDQYFKGVKQIIFTEDYFVYDDLLDLISQKFQEKEIGIQKNDIEFGRDSCLDQYRDQRECKFFNFELYLLNPGTLQVVYACIEDGELTDNMLYKELEKFSECCSFNLQQYLIEHGDAYSNISVTAGAGTGKTYSMISRIAFLCNKAIDPLQHISNELAMVTFTNDAADNMKCRLKKLFMNYVVLTGNSKYHEFIRDLDQTNIATIHSFTISILKKLSLYTGLGSQFTISSHQILRKKIYDNYLGEFLKKQSKDFYQEIPMLIYSLKSRLIEIADSLFNKNIDFKDIEHADLGDFSDYMPYFPTLIQEVLIPAEIKYFECMHEKNQMDLKECILLLNRILKDNKKVRDKKLHDYQIKYLFIDEFQDTDNVQIELFKKLQKVLGDECKIFVVGDLKQSIYAFRGATQEAFERLKGFKYDWQYYSLNQNYRTDARLLELYDSIFEQMAQDELLSYKEQDYLKGVQTFQTVDNKYFTRIPVQYKNGRSKKEYQTFLDILFQSIKEQEIQIKEQMKTQTLSSKERTIAILVRTNYQVDKMVEEGRKRGIHITVRSGGDLYKLESTHDLYALVLALQNNCNPIHLVNFIMSNYIHISWDPFSIKDKTLDEKISILTELLNNYLKKKTGKSWNEWVKEAFHQPILYVLQQLFEHCQPWQNMRSIYNAKQYVMNYECLMETLLCGGSDVHTINSIVENLRINIVTQQERESRVLLLNEDNQNVEITCLTIHKSKGLEFGTVVLPFVNEDIRKKEDKMLVQYVDSKLSISIPINKKEKIENSHYDIEKNKNSLIQEESRILYVALTRAIRNCVWFDNIDSKSEVSWATQMRKGDDENAD